MVRVRVTAEFLWRVTMTADCLLLESEAQEASMLMVRLLEPRGDVRGQMRIWG
jgi:hypothetical protein